MVKNKFKTIRTLLFISTFFILNSIFFFAHATIRYVSHTGSSTPPYTSWATAADSVQKAIDFSVSGDTIYVANGVYKEIVRMIPGISLKSQFLNVVKNEQFQCCNKSSDF